MQIGVNFPHVDVTTSDGCVNRSIDPLSSQDTLFFPGGHHLSGLEVTVVGLPLELMGFGPRLSGVPWHTTSVGLTE